MLFGKRRDKESKVAQKGANAHRDPSPKSLSTSDSAAVEIKTAGGDRAARACPATDSTVAATSDDTVPLLLAITSIGQLEQSRGIAASGKFQDGWLQLGAGDGGHAIQSFPAKEGEIFAAKAHIVLLDGGLNNVASRFFFGPLFLSSEGKVLMWWKPFERPHTDVAEVSVEARAPEGTAEVKLGIYGSWDKSGSSGDYVVGFANARLVKAAA